MINFLKIFFKVVEIQYIFIYKKFPKKKHRKFNENKVTGECHINLGEFGLLLDGIATFSKDLHVDYFCKHQDNKMNCTTHEECGYRKTND